MKIFSPPYFVLFVLPFLYLFSSFLPFFILTDFFFSHCFLLNLKFCFRNFTLEILAWIFNSVSLKLTFLPFQTGSLSLLSNCNYWLFSLFLIKAHNTLLLVLCILNICLFFVFIYYFFCYVFPLLSHTLCGIFKLLSVVISFNISFRFC